MKLKITEKKKRDIEYCAKGIKLLVELVLGVVAILGIWYILGLPTIGSTLLSIAIGIFLVVEIVPFCFDSTRLFGKKRNS